MKYLSYKILLAFALTALVYSACDHDRLDLEPLGETEDNYFDEQIDFERAVIGIYAKLSDIYWYNGGSWSHDMWLLPGDDLTTIGDYAFETFGAIQPGNGDLNNYYRRAYQLMARANVLLQKIEEEDGAYTDADLKNYHKGEALFLRGYMFFQLWNFFGTPPIITERIQSSDAINPPGSEGNQMLDQAISDLQEAASLLPGTWESANSGRVTSHSANGMLGKALVFRADVTDASADYTAAITAFNNISGRSLVANYDENFSVNHENNAESLFEFQATQPNFDNVWLDNDFDNAVGSTSAYWGFYDNNFSLFGAQRFIATQKMLDTYGPDDSRGQFFIDDEGNFLKYVVDDQLSQSGVGSVNNPRILRYADVLLLKAEAILKSGGSKAEAIGLINQVRARARNWGGGTEPADRDAGVTDDNTIMQWIMDERLLELAGEDAHRWLDLRRWHMGGDINLGSFDFSSVKDNFNFNPEKHILFPIPTGEVDLNPIIVQNPGY